MQATKASPEVNRLLAVLPRKDVVRFLRGCKAIRLEFAEVLARTGEPIRHVYFPIDSLISQLTSSEGNASLEVGLIGDEGMLGISLVLGVNVSPLNAVVQNAGSALRMTAKVFRRELDLSPALRSVMKRYLHVVLGQFAQAAACTRFHVVQARLARLLLMTRDRAHSDAFHVTHEVLADMLGVRRVGVTKAATWLQDRELIRYRRGNIEIIDPRGLEAVSCGCYAADKQAYARTMG